MATEDDVYDVVLASSSYLYAFGEFSRRRNRRRDGSESVGHGSWVKWVIIFGWVTWVMGHSQ